MDKFDNSVSLYLAGLVAAIVLLGLFNYVPLLIVGVTTLVLVGIVFTVVVAALFALAIILKALRQLLASLSF